MKEYIIDDAEKKKYVTRFYKEKNGSISVEFADGRVFRNIEYSDENIDKLIAKQEAQAKRGLDHYKTFKARLKRSQAKTGLSFAGTLGLSIAAANYIPAISELVDKSNPLVVCLGIGVVTVLGTIPAYAKLYKDGKIVEELDKVKYRNSHQDELESIDEYPNALAGLDPNKTGWMKRVTDPFSIANVDRYGIEDLETIVSNINNEKQFGFTYEKTKCR